MTGALRSRAMSWAKELPRLILAALFLLAAGDKLTHFGGFTTAVGSYRLLPEGTERFAAVFIILAEAAIALGLLLRRWQRLASLAAALLLATFTTVYLVAKPAGVCGCWFTLTLNKGGAVHILQNLVFIGLAVLTWVDSRQSFDRTGVSSAPSPVSHSTAAHEPDDGRLKHAL